MHFKLNLELKVRIKKRICTIIMKYTKTVLSTFLQEKIYKHDFCNSNNFEILNNVMQYKVVISVCLSNHNSGTSAPICLKFSLGIFGEPHECI